MEQRRDSKLVRVGITHGDINGIGYEVILKTFLEPMMLEFCIPVIYGSSKVASYHKKALNLPEFNLNLIRRADSAVPKRINIVNCIQDDVKVDFGKSTQIAGQLSVKALEMAIEDYNANLIDVIVTAPINKKNIQSEKFQFPGHTQYFADKFNSKEYLMFMISNSMKMGLVTDHIAISEVSKSISTELIIKKIKLLNRSLLVDFCIRKPRIAVLSLNPHSGDEGFLGNEENDIIIPAINKAKDDSILAFGPYSSDGFFGSGEWKKFDAILAMYHDQGLIAFKAMSFNDGVNFTSGLPIIRTSPVHGTAFEIAGQNIASPDSFRNAIYLAIDIFKSRLLYSDITKNPLKQQQLDNER